MSGGLFVPAFSLLGTFLAYKRFLDDFPAQEVGNLWTDTGTGSLTDEKIYVVQTGTRSFSDAFL